MDPRISVVIPVHNEGQELAAACASARDDNVELLVVDGGSADASVETARRAGARLVRARCCRAVQMNAGARAASGELLMFLHGDTRLPRGFAPRVRASLARPGVVAGAFELAIEGPGRSLRWIESAANWRARRLQMPYGDQALFLAASRFRAMGGFPELPLMEDFELVRRLRREGRIDVVAAAVRTSARRWRRLGPWRTTWINQIAVAAYLAGGDIDRIARWYRRERRGQQQSVAGPQQGVSERRVSR